jgi:four helix bundle protein
MFDFEQLVVDQRSKDFHLEMMRWLVSNRAVDSVTRDQLRHASLRIALNIAEGSGRFSRKDRRNFFVIARSSVLEEAAIFDILKDAGRIGQAGFGQILSRGG